MTLALTSMLMNLPKFSLETLPVILLIVVIIVLFAALLWYALSKIPDATMQSWAKWVAVLIGGILLLWFLISLVGQG